MKNRKTVHGLRKIPLRKINGKKNQVNKSKPKLLDFIRGRRYEERYYRKKMQRTTVNLLRNEKISN